MTRTLFSALLGLVLLGSLGRDAVATSGQLRARDARGPRGHDERPDDEREQGGPSGHRHGAGGHEGGHGRHDATVSHRFDDVERWVKVFDDPARAAWQKPAELVASLGLRRGDCVADLGAGTGYFGEHLSKAVGSEGVVFSVEVETTLVEHLRKRAEAEDCTNLIPVLGSFDNPRLPAARVDLVLIVDTYHHFDDRLTYLRGLRRSLRPGGRVAVVDFRKRERPVGPPLEHSLAKEVVIEEMTGAGYELSEDLDELLPHQYVLIFDRRGVSTR